MKMTLMSNGYELMVQFTSTCLTIYDSYLITDDWMKENFLKLAIEIWPEITKTRTIKSMVNEWKVHNAFFNRHWKISHTKDTDMELHQDWIHKILYSILSKLLPEK